MPRVAASPLIPSWAWAVSASVCVHAAAVGAFWCCSHRSTPPLLELPGGSAFKVIVSDLSEEHNEAEPGPIAEVVDAVASPVTEASTQAPRYDAASELLEHTGLAGPAPPPREEPRVESAGAESQRTDEAAPTVVDERPVTISSPIPSLTGVESRAHAALNKLLETLGGAARAALAARASSVRRASSGGGASQAAPANAQRGVYRAPSPLAANKPPLYPIEARRRRQMGTVLLRVVIEADGAVSRVSIARSSGHELLDGAASEAAAAWRFSPAVHAGSAQRCEADLPVEFVLK